MTAWSQFRTIPGSCLPNPKRSNEDNDLTGNSFTPGPTPNTVRAADGKVLTAPQGWVLLPPGDAALTRRVKAAGEHWVVQEKKGRKVFSRGIWAPAATIERIRVELDAERIHRRIRQDARRPMPDAGTRPRPSTSRTFTPPW